MKKTGLHYWLQRLSTHRWQRLSTDIKSCKNEIMCASRKGSLCRGGCLFPTSLAVLLPSWKRPQGRTRDTLLTPFLHSDTTIQDLRAGAPRRGHQLPTLRLLPDKLRRKWWWWAQVNTLILEAQFLCKFLAKKLELILKCRRWQKPGFGGCIPTAARVASNSL